jgi:hypothetical protein
MITRAHQLDPLEPKYDVLKAEELAWGRSDLHAADALLVGAVSRPPLFQPAVSRLADNRHTEGNFADAILYGEQALKLDPLSDWTRRMLVINYSELQDPVAARAVADEAPHPLPILRLPLWMRPRSPTPPMRTAP